MDHEDGWDGGWADALDGGDGAADVLLEHAHSTGLSELGLGEPATRPGMPWTKARGDAGGDLEQRIDYPVTRSEQAEAYRLGLSPAQLREGRRAQIEARRQATKRRDGSWDEATRHRLAIAAEQEARLAQAAEAERARRSQAAVAVCELLQCTNVKKLDRMAYRAGEPVIPYLRSDDCVAEPVVLELARQAAIEPELFLEFAAKVVWKHIDAGCC